MLQNGIRCCVLDILNRTCQQLIEKNLIFFSIFIYFGVCFFFFFPQNLPSHLKADMVAKTTVNVIFWKNFQNCQNLSTHYLAYWSRKTHLHFSGDPSNHSDYFFQNFFSNSKKTHKKTTKPQRQWNEVKAIILITQKLHNVTWGVAFFIYFNSVVGFIFLHCFLTQCRQNFQNLKNTCGVRKPFPSALWLEYDRFCTENIAY